MRAETGRPHRLPRDKEDPCSEPRYHYRGYRIERVTRDWDARGFRGGMTADPKVSWEVHRAFRSKHWPLHTAFRLSDAKAWCDRQIEAS